MEKAIGVLILIGTLVIVGSAIGFWISGEMLWLIPMCMMIGIVIGVGMCGHPQSPFKLRKSKS